VNHIIGRGWERLSKICDTLVNKVLGIKSCMKMSCDISREEEFGSSSSNKGGYFNNGGYFNYGAILIYVVKVCHR